MRFLADGPNIPDELLEARDRGEVVFLCGAGVSYPAGMPDFLGLAQYVIQELGTLASALSREMLSVWDNCEVREAARPSLDQIFNLLQMEYEASEIESLIAKRLRTRPQTDVSTHKTILRLSRSADGKPQIVTTNFDLLFQYADNKLTHYVPPNLPNLEFGQGLNGLVYLHGRINNRVGMGQARQGLVVSSSDFGQAYLAEGWATRFMLDLLDRYTVVLLGYSASDPPVRYLLQGLRKARSRNAANIYAFDRGAEEKVRGRWRDSEVRVLAYPETDSTHSALWNTLEAWAERADDPPAWRQRVVELARTGPRNLRRHERGQVASLVRTFEGAKVLAVADPPPPGEWLCVFDRSVRFGPVDHDFRGRWPDFDPLLEYGLDDDPPRPIRNRADEKPPGDDLLSIRVADPRADRYLRLAGMPGIENIPLPPRLFQLALWIVKIAHEPVALWWAARYLSLHPFLIVRIEQRIRRGAQEFPGQARSIWNLLTEVFRATHDEDDLSLFAVDDRIKAEGWSNGVLREFERSIAPQLSTKSRHGRGPGRPPEREWTYLQLSEIAAIDVGFPHILDIESEIPDEVLPAVYRIGRRQLEVAAGLLGELDQRAQQRMKSYLRNSTGPMRGDNPNIYLKWFRDLLSGMIETRPERVRADMVLWPEEDPYFFIGLRLYAWTFDTLFTGDEVGDGLLSLSDATFWDSSNSRALLHLLQDRWQEFSDEKRKLIEERILGGREKYEGESDEHHNRWSSIQSARILGWLATQECELTNATQAALPLLRSAHPDWSPEWDEDADDDSIREGGRVRTDSDASVLLRAPVSQVISLAYQNTKSSHEYLVDYKPFNGLVQQCPNRAVAALTLAGKRGEYPGEFWRSLLQEWPDNARPRLTCLLGARVARLPAEVVMVLRYELFSWLKKNSPTLATMGQTRALSIFDALLDKLFTGGADVTDSVAGDSQGWSRRTMEYAINGSVGNAVQFLFVILGSHSLGNGAGIPSELKSRFERLIVAPGEGSGHAVCLIAHKVEWLHDLDPEWACNTVVPWFEPDHPNAESAWNGILFRDRLPGPALFPLLRPHFLKVFDYASEWKWNDEGFKALHEFLVCGCLWGKHDEVYLTFAETRRALQLTDDAGRNHSIIFLTELIEKDQVSWHQFGKTFLVEAWPKETRLQTEDTSLSLARLAGVTGDNFPEAVQTILPRLVQIYGDSWFLYHVVSRGGNEEIELATEFPEATLVLVNKLVPDNPSEGLFDLNPMLEKIAEAKPGLRQDWQWGRLKRIARQE